MTVTLADIARQAGVSLATASRVINGSSRKVTPELRVRVLEAADKLNYVPNAHAQALARSSTSTIGVIVHDVSDPYFSEITRGIQRVASEANRLVMLCNSFRDPARELAYVELLRAQRVEAMVLAGSGLDDRNYSQALATQIDGFVASGGQVAFVGRHHIAGSAVIPDNVGGARALAQALIDLGHRDFGVISGPGLLTTTRDRFDGFRMALTEAGIALPPQQVITSDFTRDGGATAVLELLKQAPHITALFALNDSMAIGVLAALRAQGIQVPADISVVGFDDIPVTRDVTPMLSTVHVPMDRLGARAVELALEAKPSELRVEYVATHVVLRGSTAAPKLKGSAHACSSA